MDGEAGLVVRTVGHSNHDLARLLRLLRDHQITVLADVRSAPYSRYSPQFNRPELERALPAHEIRYEFLGQKLGGRPDDPECYDEAGHVVYDRMEETSEYRQGIDEVLALAEGGERVCLMCSEEDPAICHRAISIGHFLAARDVAVEHIRGDGHTETQHELRGKAINQPLQFSLFEEAPARKSLQPIAREGRPGASGSRDDRDRDWVEGDQFSFFDDDREASNWTSSP